MWIEAKRTCLKLYEALDVLQQRVLYYDVKAITIKAASV